MLSMTIENSIPRKVLAKAQQLGVHNDCLISGNPCGTCNEHIYLAFDFFYGHLASESDLLAAIVEDFRNDIEEEES